MQIRIRVAAILIKNNKVLLVNHKKSDQSYWLLPGGGVEQNETLIEALKRELKEETSLDIEPKELLFVCESISKDKRHILHINFRVESKSGDLKVGKDNRLKDAAFFRENEINNLKIYPNIKNIVQKILRKENIESLYLGNLWH